MNDAYCPYINHQLLVDYNGHARVCCQFEEKFPLDEAEPYLESYRTSMSNGQRLKQCRRCYNDESQGLYSLRQSAIEDFKRYENPEGLVMLDLRVTNSCNLACIMCKEEISTYWGKLIGREAKYSLDKKMQNRLIAMSHNLIKLSIQGGEPFYGKEFINFVNRLPNKKQMQLEIFTNVISINEKILENWTNEFNQVMLICSVDGVSEVFENIRWPAKWKKLNQKLSVISNIKNLNWNLSFVLQNLNLLNLKDYMQWRDSNFPKTEITINVLEHPRCYHYLVITEQERDHALEQLRTISARMDEQRIIDSVIKNLESQPLRTELLEEKQNRLLHTSNLREKMIRGAS